MNFQLDLELTADDQEELNELLAELNQQEENEMWEDLADAHSQQVTGIPMF